MHDRDLHFRSALFKGDDFVHTDIPFVGRSSERRRLSEVMAAYGAPASSAGATG